MSDLYSSVAMYLLYILVVHRICSPFFPWSQVSFCDLWFRSAFQDCPVVSGVVAWCYQGLRYASDSLRAVEVSKELFGVYLVYGSVLDWWVVPDPKPGFDLESCWRRLPGMSHCRAVFNLSDPGSLVWEIYRQCASNKFLQTACSAFGSQAGFLDQHTCTQLQSWG